MYSSTQTNPVVITVDTAGFAALIPSQLPEGTLVHDIDSGALYIVSGGLLTPAGPEFSATAESVGAANLPGTAITVSRGDHVHEGVHSVTDGAGLLNSGNATDVILNVVANADGSIIVNPDDIQVGVLFSDAQHGVRGGGTQHAVATTAVAGFQSAADKLRQNQTQGGTGVTAAGTALITPPVPFDPLGGINVTKSGAAALTSSVVLQVTAFDGLGLNFTVTSVDAAGLTVNEAVAFRWSTTPS